MATVTSQAKLHGEIPLAGQRAQAAARHPGRGDMLGQVTQVGAGEDEGQAALDLLAARAADAGLPGLAGGAEAVGGSTRSPSSRPLAATVSRANSGCWRPQYRRWRSANSGR